METKEIRILLVDDHCMVRQGLRRLIEERDGFTVVGEAATGRETLQLVRSLSPDVIVMDIHLPGENGIEVSRQILAEFRSIKVIVLSSDLSLQLIHDALQAGVSAYVIKAAALEELMRAIAIVLDQRIYLCPEVASEVANDYMNMLGKQVIPASKPTLTDRERRLLKLVAEGKRNKEIAEALEVGLKSVETYRSRLMKKLGCANANELTRHAIREGIAPL